MQAVTAVKPLEAYHLELIFNTGERRVFDAGPYLNRGVFARLKNPELFRQAFVAYDTACWPGELDIAPDTLYARSHPAQE